MYDMIIDLKENLIQLSKITQYVHELSNTCRKMFFTLAIYLSSLLVIEYQKPIYPKRFINAHLPIKYIRSIVFKHCNQVQ